MKPIPIAATLLLTLALTVFTTSAAKPHSVQAERLNVLFIAIDDLNDWWAA
jgi:hypothetical protein